MAEKVKGPRTLKEALKGRLTGKEISILRGSYDVVGDIAVIEVPDELAGKERLIADTLLSMHRHIRVVCRKVGGHTGEYRRQKLRIVSGQRRKSTEYRENNVRIMLHLESCYFSPRLSDERKRIAGLVRPGERVLVMFSGVAPYPIVISKNSDAAEIVGIEKNPAAHRYALLNARLNKTGNVRLYQGDVRSVLPGLLKSRGRFDRVLMPLPKGAADFLGLALSAAKKGAAVHMYDFLHENEFSSAFEKAESACREAGRACRMLGLKRCGSQSPRTYRVVLDFEVF